MIRLEDSRQQLTYILEDVRAIRSVALMAMRSMTGTLKAAS